MRIDLAAGAGVEEQVTSGRNSRWHAGTFPIGFAATEKDLRPLSRIRSLAYFQPVIEELQDHPVPDGFRDIAWRDEGPKIYAFR